MRDKNRRREDVLYYFPGWGLSEFFVDEEIFNRRVAAAAGRPALHGLKHTDFQAAWRVARAWGWLRNSPR
jgi:hypothetical protein